MPDTLLTHHRGLGALVHAFRQDLDIYHLVHPHQVLLRERNSELLTRYSPDRALRSAAWAARRIYGEREIGDWHSIPAVLRCLPPDRASRAQAAAVRRFGRRHGHRDEGIEPVPFLLRTCGYFLVEYSAELVQIRAFAESRDYSPDAPFARDRLPSKESFEKLLDFAGGFHRIVATTFDVGAPVPARRTARARLRRLLQEEGIDPPAGA